MGCRFCEVFGTILILAAIAGTAFVIQDNICKLVRLDADLADARNQIHDQVFAGQAKVIKDPTTAGHYERLLGRLVESKLYRAFVNYQLECYMGVFTGAIVLTAEIYLLQALLRKKKSELVSWNYYAMSCPLLAAPFGAFFYLVACIYPEKMWPFTLRLAVSSLSTFLLLALLGIVVDNVICDEDNATQKQKTTEENRRNGRVAARV